MRLPRPVLHAPRARSPRRDLTLLGGSVLVGGFAALGAWAFRELVGLVHNVLFLGRLQFAYDVQQHTHGVLWNVRAVGVPMLGALVVAWLVTTYAPEARGAGVPEVMDAVRSSGGRMRPVVAVVKPVASALSIGSGASVGREGPMVQIGAVLAGPATRLIGGSDADRQVLVAAGAAAGIAAAFDAPLGGALFAIELLLVAPRVGSVLSVAVAAVGATVVSRALLGGASAVVAVGGWPTRDVLGSWGLALLVPLGVMAGVASAALTRGVYWIEDHLDAMPGGRVSRHVAGMAVVGLVLLLVYHATGHYYVEGLGYATVADVLGRILTDPWLLLGLFVAKLLTTSLSLGSGASGGIFSPALFLGATLGAVWGIVVHALLPGTALPAPVFALAGMAAVVAGSTGALLAGAVMVAEMSASYVTLPALALAVGAAWVARQPLERCSVYTAKLARRGHPEPENAWRRIGARDREPSC